jgi:hypothetical protein
LQNNDETAQSAAMADGADPSAAGERKISRKKIPTNSIHLQVAGDLLFARCSDRTLNAQFKRYETLLEKFANMEREERMINYCFLVGLILTSHAKRTQDKQVRRDLFDRKNELFLKLANARSFRKKLSFLYLDSKNFLVLEYCPACKALNENTTLPKHKWHSCKECKIDRKFYNVLAIHHKFLNGSATMFLSNDLIHKVVGLKPPQVGDIDHYKEEAKYQKYHYNTQTLSVFSLESTLKAHAKLLTIQSP